MIKLTAYKFPALSTPDLTFNESFRGGKCCLIYIVQWFVLFAAMENPATSRERDTWRINILCGVY